MHVGQFVDESCGPCCHNNSSIVSNVPDTVYICLWGRLLTSTVGLVVILWTVCSAFDGMSAL